MPIDGDGIERELNGRRRRVTRETGSTRGSFHSFAAARESCIAAKDRGCLLSPEFPDKVIMQAGLYK